MSGRWLDVTEAARVLGISTDAVRKRISRGSLRADRQDGRVVVWLDDGVAGESGVLRSDEELIRELRERIESLERQLEEANVRDREQRRIIAALTNRIPQLEAPPEARESAQSESEASADSTPEPARRPLWRRIFRA